MINEKILILDFGGQYSQLIARRIRECKVCAVIKPYNTTLEEIRKLNPRGIVFSGGPNSVYDLKSPACSDKVLKMGIPILGICYGAQLLAHKFGALVESSHVCEYGHTNIKVDSSSALFSGLPASTTVWMSHTDYVSAIPPGFIITATSANCPVAAMECIDKKIYAVQFHPEVLNSIHGKRIIRNFVVNICACQCDWQMDAFATATIKNIKEKVGNGRVLCALSGGVDSSVAAVLTSMAIGKQLTCVFVDHGLLRKDEANQVESIFGPDGPYKLNFIRVNAEACFFRKLKGITDPEKKRKIIGEEFIRVFEEEAKKIGNVDYLVQGTIYPDVIESGLNSAAVIKSHHNVGGLPDVVNFKEIIEPLRMLFKDEVRQVGLGLGLPENLVNRQPFPGPGLGIRIIGEVTADKVRIIQEADAIYREEIDNAGLSHSVGQYFAALTNMHSVGVMGDCRTYDYAVVLRAVNTVDFMTAQCTQIPYEVLLKTTSRIINEVKGVNRVMYDLTSKPPGTIEME